MATLFPVKPRVFSLKKGGLYPYFLRVLYVITHSQKHLHYFGICHKQNSLSPDETISYVAFFFEGLIFAFVQTCILTTFVKSLLKTTLRAFDFFL